MKKLLCVLLIALTLVPLAACGGEKDKVTAAADSADNQAPEASVSQKQPSEKKSESKPAASEPTQSTDGVDVDLTRLSSTMVYSEVYNMMNAPGDYIGKTIKMKGQFAIGYVYNTDGTPDESTAPVSFSLQNIYNHFFAAFGRSRFYYGTDGLGDSALTSDHLTHIRWSYLQFDNNSVILFCFGNDYFVRIFNKRFCNYFY